MPLLLMILDALILNSWFIFFIWKHNVNIIPANYFAQSTINSMDLFCSKNETLSVINMKTMNVALIYCNIWQGIKKSIKKK